MTREEIIYRGEEQLQYTYSKTKLSDIPKSEVIGFAEKGLAQLNMLHYILEEDYENYNVWFDKFCSLL